MMYTLMARDSSQEEKSGELTTEVQKVERCWLKQTKLNVWW